jgi:hypothetical protein
MKYSFRFFGNVYLSDQLRICKQWVMQLQHVRRPYLKRVRIAFVVDLECRVDCAHWVRCRAAQLEKSFVISARFGDSVIETCRRIG